MIRGVDGVSGLFDALLFLTIASVVSVALLSAFAGYHPDPAGQEQDRVESAHLVLLRSTLPDGQGNLRPVEELFILEDVDLENYLAAIRSMVELLLPDKEWRWTVQRGDEIIDMGSRIVPEEDVDIYCSLVRTNVQGEEIIIRLEAWSTP